MRTVRPRPLDDPPQVSLVERNDVIQALAAHQLFVERGPPTYLRSDNGPEFTATVVRDWLHRVGVTTLWGTKSRSCGDACLQAGVRDPLRWRVGRCGSCFA